MARKRAEDFLQDFRFALIDIEPQISGSAFIFNAAFGFSEISGMNFQTEFAQHHPANQYYPVQFIKGATASPITCRRGARLSDGDFWRWYIASLTGDPGSISNMSGRRRNLMLIHYLTFKGIPNVPSPGGGSTGGGGSAGAVAQGIGQNAVTTFFLQGDVPARAWVLYNCLPTQVNPAGTFNANSGAVSVIDLSFTFDDADEQDLSM